MFWCAEAELALTRYRAYDPELGRWLSRDPLENAELSVGPNLYAYVNNNPISNVDPLGLCTGTTLCKCLQPQNVAACSEAGIIATGAAQVAQRAAPVAQEAAKYAPRCAGIIDALPARVQALTIEYETVAPTLIRDYRDRLEAMRYLDPGILGRGVPLWTDVMVRLDREFMEIVELMMARYGMSEARAQQLLAQFVNFFPEEWGTAAAAGQLVP
jgi:RHS repeat-associated protein